MSTTLEKIEAEVLKLSPVDRSRLLERLYSLIEPDPEIDRAWELEAARRDAEIEAGTVKEIPGDEAIARIRRSIR